MKFLLLICFFLTSAPVMAADGVGFDQAPAALLPGIKYALEKLNLTDAELKNEYCDSVDARGSIDRQPGVLCGVSISSVDIYAAGTESPSKTRMLRLICVREYVDEDCRTVLIVMMMIYDIAFLEGPDWKTKLAAFFNNIAKQPKGRPQVPAGVVLQGVSATYVGQAFLFKNPQLNMQHDVVNIEIRPRK